MKRLNDVFLVDGDNDDWRDGIDGQTARKTFYDKLNLISAENSGKLPLTHVTSRSNLESIKKNGILPAEASGGTEVPGKYVYMTVGHNDNQSWTRLGNESVALYIELPREKIHNVQPDLNINEMWNLEDGEPDDEFIELLQNWPNVIGAEVTLGEDEKIESVWIVDMIDLGSR